MVGLGASAGGLTAFEKFFAGIPADSVPPQAFVLVQHLAPDRHSLLGELLQRHTTMPVAEITDGLTIAPGHVYIAPPDREVALEENTLRLRQPSATRGHRLPIDTFFCSLAHARRERAVGIVLSGTGRDGTAGITAIKAQKGLVLVQSPASCDFDGMPRSAIATGLVDYQGPADTMADRLLDAPPAASPPEDDSAPVTGLDEATVQKVNALVLAHTGHDFSLYKRGTIHRRIGGRMAIHRIDRLADYVKYLEHTAEEVDALFNDLLIGVTQFFRDPAVFRQMEKSVIPKLLGSARPPGEPIRVWVPGCSTGEEAYTIAILLLERLAALKKTHRIQIFATDISPAAIATARAGVYPAAIAKDLTPKRLAHYFTAEPGGKYRIHKNVRNLLVFSEQDVNRDPPFSQLDLISCRNLLIYFGGELQQKLIPLFHYALKPGGVLLLGPSEGASEFADLFSPLDRRAKIYQRKHTPDRAAGKARRRLTAQPIRAGADDSTGRFAPSPNAAERPLREATERALLLQFAAAGILVDHEGDILYRHGRTGLFLETDDAGAETNNLLKMARAGLRRDLSTTLRAAVRTGKTVRSPNLRIKTNGHFTGINLSVQPVTLHRTSLSDTQGYLVVLELIATPTARLRSGARGATIRRLATLQDELQAKDDFLQRANVELQDSTERLKSSNAAMQAINEKLQSTNEELETSQEELQSLNEEMDTVNTELQAKVGDLTRANNDMNNLLAGTGIATLFLDPDLRVMRFTPSIGAIINLIPGDLGRPVAHLVCNLAGYDHLVTDAQSVLNTLEPKRKELMTRAGAWYTMQIQPYRTQENAVEGVVVTFVDISETVKTREGLRRANDLLRLAVVVRDSRDALTVHDLSGRILAWNPGAVALYGWSEPEALNLNLRDRIPLPERERESHRIARLCAGDLLEPYLSPRLQKSGGRIDVTITLSALHDEVGKICAIAATERASKSG